MIEFQNVRLGYGGRIIFDSLDIVISSDDFLGVIGPNGSGKTTLLRGIIGLLKPLCGRVRRTRRLRFGYCMQRQIIDTLFPFSIQEIVMMARTPVIGPLRKPGCQDRDLVQKALETTGLQSLSKTRFYNLSGGQKQRVLIARALALEPDILILDEPTTDLDIRAGSEIMELIENIHRRKKLAVVLVSHELNVVVNYANKVMFLNKDTAPEVYPMIKVLEEDVLSGIFDFPVKIIQVNKRRFVFPKDIKDV